VAAHIQAATGGELFEITAAVPYPDDCDACLERASRELASDHRPELSSHVSDMDEYSVVLAGYPKNNIKCPVVKTNGRRPA
jgi:flavodoxin